MTLEQSHALKQAFNTAADETGYVSWIKSMQIAKDLNLEYEQVWHQTTAAGNSCCVYGIPLMPFFVRRQPLPTCIMLCCLFEPLLEIAWLLVGMYHSKPGAK